MILFEMQVPPRPTESDSALIETPMWFVDMVKLRRPALVTLKANKRRKKIQHLLFVAFSPKHVLLVSWDRTFWIIIIHTLVALYNLTKVTSHLLFCFLCSTTLALQYHHLHREASAISILQMWKLRLRVLSDFPVTLLPNIRVRSQAQVFCCPNSQLIVISTLFINDEWITADPFSISVI